MAQPPMPAVFHTRVAQPPSAVSSGLTFVSHSPTILPMEKARENGILIIAASIIAVIRLRGEPITRSPKVVATISDSVRLARMVMEAVKREG